ncbi:putative ribonuclease H-like domain-containing protein [Tanacetum coccineum]
MNEFCAKKGIKREFSVARTPQQNGVAKRKNRTLIEAARTMLADSLLPIPFWVEAVNTACYGKFDGKSDEGYLLGYSTSSKAFRVSLGKNKRTYSEYILLIHYNRHRTRTSNKECGSGAQEQLLQLLLQQGIQVLEDDFDKEGQHQMPEDDQIWQDKLKMMDKYVAEILKKFDFANVKTASTPIETQKPLVKDEEASDVDVHLYRSMIGSLMYLTASRPDIMFAVCACSRFQVTPKSSHLSVVKRIFRYLKGKPKLGLWYPKVSTFDLESYSDSDYAGANLDRKSTTGGCQFLGRRLISWQCKKQTIVATSTTKAEYVAAASCCGQVLWIQNQMLDYGFNFMNTKIYIDNESTICIVKNPVYHSKTKHIAIRHHFIRDAYEKKLIQVLKIHTDDNVADLLPKAFDVSRGLIEFRESLRRVTDGTEALLIPTFFILWLDKVSIDSAKLVPLGKVCTAIETLKKHIAKALISLLTTITLSTTMVVLDSCPKHNMVAYLEKSEGNAEFHKIIDFLKRSSIHHALTARIEADRLLAEKLQEQEIEQFTIEERAKFLHDTIAAQRKFLAQQRSEAIRNRPPTKNQLRNQMMTYLKHVGNFKHSKLKIKKFEEIQVLYEKIKRKKIKSRKRRYIQNTSDDDSEKENEELRLHLTIAPDGEKEVDYEILDRKYPIKEWKTECLGTKPQVDKGENLEEINQNVVIRRNGQKRYFSTLMGVLSIFDREDLNAVYQLVMDRYQDEIPEGFDRVLWGDLIGYHCGRIVEKDGERMDERRTKTRKGGEDNEDPGESNGGTVSFVGWGLGFVRLMLCCVGGCDSLRRIGDGFGELIKFMDIGEGFFDLGCVVGCAGGREDGGGRGWGVRDGGTGGRMYGFGGILRGVLPCIGFVVAVRGWGVGAARGWCSRGLVGGVGVCGVSVEVGV